MSVLKYEIEICHIDKGHALKFKIPGKNGADALGKLISGEMSLSQPTKGDPTNLTIQRFHPNKEYVIMGIRAPGKSYPEMEGRVI